MKNVIYLKGVVEKQYYPTKVLPLPYFSVKKYFPVILANKYLWYS